MSNGAVKKVEVVSKTDEIRKVDEKCPAIVASAKAVKIGDEASLEVAKNLVIDIRDLMKEVEESYGPLKKSAHKTWKAIVAEENKQLSPLKEAKTTVEGAIGNYIRILQEEARLEEERLEKEREAEIARITKRLQKHIDGHAEIKDQITMLEDKLKAGNLDDNNVEAINRQLNALYPRLEAKAETVERNQSQVEEAAYMTTAPAKTPTSLKGVGGGRMERIPEVFNLEALFKAVAAGQAPMGLFNLNEGKLKKYVNDFPTVRLPGVKVTPKPVVRVSG